MRTLPVLTLALAAMLGCSAEANESVIRRALAERLPPNFPALDEVRPSPIPGLFELRFGTEIRYTDAKGEFLFEGDLIDLKTRKSLTQERVEKLTAVNFEALPLKDAIVWKRGNGKQRVAVFADPNCGYCKRFERTLQELKDVTVYTFVIPILGSDSREKTRNIWCAKDSTDAWLGWMLANRTPDKVSGNCDEAPIERNLAFARKHAIHGTPAVVFEDGTRAPGAIPLDVLVKRLAEAEKRS